MIFKKGEEKLFFARFQVKNKTWALLLHLSLLSTSQHLIISRLFSLVRTVFVFGPTSLCHSLVVYVHLLVFTLHLILKSEASVRILSENQQQW